MALNFPINPADGDTYEGYVYDATAGVWNSDPHQIASRFVTSATAPSSASEGDGWFDTNTAKSYVFYDGVWVQLGALGTVDLNQIADVNVSSPANGESLVYDGTDWVNQNVSVDVYDVSTNSTGKFALPSGTTEQRPESPNAGDIRFNTTIGEPEYYSESEGAWFLFRQAAISEFEVQYLVIAGGGGGSEGHGGGGGAGGYRSSVAGEPSGGGGAQEPTLLLSGGSYNVTVGAGGASANDGSASVFSTIDSTGGGHGGGASTGAASPGGSGGGGRGYSDGLGSGAAGTLNQGYSGGTGDATSAGGEGGGGGGAASVGQNAATAGGRIGGDGGAGIISSITGSPVGRAGGGGGGGYSRESGYAPGDATAGGGNGAPPGAVTVGVSATPNTGGGGGGGGDGGGAGGPGGSGIVIIKYPSTVTASPSVGLVYSTSLVGDYKVTQFTGGTGTVSFTTNAN